LPEGEIISATKLSIFNQCPLKYQLTYVYGFTKLMNQFKDWKYHFAELKQEFNLLEENAADNEEENKIFHSGEVKGRIIHRILQEEIDKSDLRKYIEELVKQELKNQYNVEEGLQEFINDIAGDLEKFYESGTYAEICRFSNYKNEYEVYSLEENHFLYGIIDRLIIEGKKAIIIDFKTDDIKKSEIQQRFESYLTQLKFYSYIVSRLYKDIEEFDLKIIFIKYPDENVSLQLKKNDLEEIKTSIKKMVIDTRLGTYKKNLDHCQKCIFSINHNRCIVH
jgi:ATP-dependent exoDNAse (exonuclease V) beta subunit